ncbi:MAG: hypothetical protein V2J07_09210 [Anaerolineae bacterium]|jgi:uncharacterized lipoprotein YddW (UPF0748 family)|nr:hypothetical protein [Anaerolineae bacterium]
MRKGTFVSGPLSKKKVQQIIELGINEISLSWHNYDPDHVQSLRTEGVRVFTEISLFAGKEWWGKYPDSRPIARDGNPMEPIHWYHGVCPNHPGVRKDHLQTIDHIINDFNADGIWLDFIRYPCHWEEVRSSDITEYCFCKVCREKFTAEVGERMQGSRWTQWKSAQITGFVREVYETIEMYGKEIQLGIFAVPWTPDDFHQGITRIIGQDFKALSSYVDVFGAMAYHKIMEKPVEWIGNIVSDIAGQTRKSVIPLVQSISQPDRVSAEEFASALSIGLQSSGEGVMVFHFEDMLEDEQKTQALQTLFT